MIRALVRAAAIVALLATTTAAAGPDFATLEVRTFDPPKPAPPFSLPGLDGRVTSLSDLRGKVALLFFWATW